MRLSWLCASVHVLWAATFSFNAYDLGLHGLYPHQDFHSVDFQPPKPKITKENERCSSGYLFLTPRGPKVQGPARGPVILDQNSELVWMGGHQFKQAMNFNVQKYKGEDYLTFWTKIKKTKKHGKLAKKSKKSYVMLNSAYEVAYTIRPHGHGLKADSHEFRITPEGTALITIYKNHQADCTDLKLGTACWIQDGIFQEIDIETGKLLFEWRATDHIPMTSVYTTPNSKDGHGKSKKDAFDYFHINAVDKLPSGDYLISARYMHAAVCISGKTGEVLWQLGGKHNTFKSINGATDFEWQHHVSWQGNNTISLFDNHRNTVVHGPSVHSKGMLIHLDFEQETATLLHKYVHPDSILAVSQGSIQLLPPKYDESEGNVLVGFGNSPAYVEYSRSGEVLCAAHFAPHIAFELIDFGLVKSYRIFKHRWVGKPKTIPDVKMNSGRLYVSWNGATEVKGWRLEVASSDDEMRIEEFATYQAVEKKGFETSFKFPHKPGTGHEKYVRVVALDAENEVMEYSAIITVSPSASISTWATLCIWFFALVVSGSLVFVVFSRKPLEKPSWFDSLPLASFLPKMYNFKAWLHTPPHRRSREDEERDAEYRPLLPEYRDS